MSRGGFPRRIGQRRVKVRASAAATRPLAPVLDFARARCVIALLRLADTAEERRRYLALLRTGPDAAVPNGAP